MKDLKVIPCYVCACSPLVVDDMVFVVTGNGTDEQGKIHLTQGPQLRRPSAKTTASWFGKATCRATRSSRVSGPIPFMPRSMTSRR